MRCSPGDAGRRENSLLTLPLGGGWVNTSHGQTSLPAPATVEIIKDFHIPCYGLPLEEETVTPTGAALLGTFSSAYQPLPPMIIETIGYGAGSRTLILPTLSGPSRAYLPVADNFHTPAGIQRKVCCLNRWKFWRPVLTISILRFMIVCNGKIVFRWRSGCLFYPYPDEKTGPPLKLLFWPTRKKTHQLGGILLRGTTTLGYRRQSARKIMLPRKQVLLDTPWGQVRVKLAGQPPHCKISPRNMMIVSDCTSARDTTKNYLPQNLGTPIINISASFSHGQAGTSESNSLNIYNFDILSTNSNHPMLFYSRSMQKK